MKLFLKTSALALALSFATTGCISTPDVKTDDKKDDKKDSKAGGDAKAGGGGGGGAPAYDPRDSMMAMSPMIGFPKDGAGVKEGLWVTRTSSGAAKNTEKWAVVGDAGDSVWIEYQGTGTQGFIQGLIVKKADGVVTKAVAGKKGEKGKDIKIFTLPATKAGEPPPTTDEDCAVKAGSFKSKKMVLKMGETTNTTWSGVDGDTAGVMLKSSDGKNDYELTAIASEEVQVGGKATKVKHLTYSNGWEYWTAPDVQAPFVSYGGVGGTQVKTVMMGNTSVADWGEGAKAELDWGKK